MHFGNRPPVGKGRGGAEKRFKAVLHKQHFRNTQTLLTERASTLLPGAYRLIVAVTYSLPEKFGRREAEGLIVKFGSE